MADAPDAPGPSAPAPPPARRRGARANLRRRDDDDDDAAADPSTTVVKRAKATGGGALAFSTRDDRDASRPVAHRYMSDRTLQSGKDDLATAALETETAFDRDARAVKKAALATAAAGPGADDGVYRGARGYVDHTAGFKRELVVASDRGTATGPLRAATAMRTTVRVDYAPDICKDYKETGYCGYGDACKFMHDRGDHKAGWQIDREWEEKQKKEAERKKQEDAWADGGEAEQKEGDDDDDDGLPFACFICRRPWDEESDPVVTRCGHYFCEQCALKRHAAPGGGACAACGKATGGTFNVAHAIARKVKRKGREGG